MTISLNYEDYDLGSMTWEDAEEAIPAADFVVLPTGSIEQHATHLPVAVDTPRAENLTRELVTAAPEHDLSMVRLPTLPTATRSTTCPSRARSRSSRTPTARCSNRCPVDP